MDEPLEAMGCPSRSPLRLVDCSGGGRLLRPDRLPTHRADGDRPDRDKEINYQLGRVLRAGGCSDAMFWKMVALERARPGREADLCDAVAA
jgi:hypothetical protein